MDKHRTSAARRVGMQTAEKVGRHCLTHGAGHRTWCTTSCLGPAEPSIMAGLQQARGAYASWTPPPHATRISLALQMAEHVVNSGPTPQIQCIWRSDRGGVWRYCPSSNALGDSGIPE